MWRRGLYEIATQKGKADFRTKEFKEDCEAVGCDRKADRYTKLDSKASGEEGS